MENNVKFDIKTLETDMIKQSIELEKRIALDALNRISSAFTENILFVNGVRFIKKIKPKEIAIGRVSVTWERPIYEGSRNGKTVYFYPADGCLKPPRKTKQSYWALSIVSLLGAFIPHKLVCKIMKILCGTQMSESSVQRYTETVGQFAKENIKEILENRQSLSSLKKDEILIVSVDGTSSMITGNNTKLIKGKPKKNKKGGKQTSKKKRRVIF